MLEAVQSDGALAFHRFFVVGMTLGIFVARILTAGGRLRDRQRVGATARGQQLAPVVALSKHRGELVGWVAQSVGEGDTSGGTVRAAKARDGGT